MVIREMTVDDADRFLKLELALDQETTFMLYEPEERQMTVQDQQKKIENLMNQEHTTALTAEDSEGQLIGFAVVMGNQLNRIRHRASIVVGVLQAHSGQGIGSKLLEAGEEWAQDRGITRLELTVMGHNRRALGLYDKMGYKIEGMRKKAILMNDEYVDEFYMGKILE
ncbi:GNAT family N-acetyltransferase [Tuberibacillus sp. Marseille-P3662]|uniref:GNAT family N-acetyltransferase n=1 Tax=Tuberibacillus sp. Marseille-P3662 TaxID=1965358 RepID=UPI0020CB326D|nr:GNAT family N-acetyltransferase [Tuberibacillus sp. Marseille-P3662]